jgi:hypothetical protein
VSKLVDVKRHKRKLAAERTNAKNRPRHVAVLYVIMKAATAGKYCCGFIAVRAWRTPSPTTAAPKQTLTKLSSAVTLNCLHANSGCTIKRKPVMKEVHAVYEKNGG